MKKVDYGKKTLDVVLAKFQFDYEFIDWFRANIEDNYMRASYIWNRRVKRLDADTAIKMLIVSDSLHVVFGTETEYYNKIHKTIYELRLNIDMLVNALHSMKNRMIWLM